MTMSYRFKRRNFLSSVGGALGLHAMLRNAEVKAAGVTSPARLMVYHHPVGTIRNDWLCEGSGTDFTLSRILAPFEALKSDMVVLDGLDLRMGNVGGGHERGTVIMMTGCPTRFTRAGQTEADDPCADGPSVDQLLLAKSEALKGAPILSLQALCDDRIDFQEISTRCLSYDYTRKSVQTVQGGSQQENTPMRPTLRPYDLYQRVFANVIPGGGDPSLAAARAAKKSVLDFSLRELARLRTLAPSTSRDVLDAHETAIRNLEAELDGMVDPTTCMIPEPPSTSLEGGVDDGGNHDDYGDPSASSADHELHKQVAEAHLAVIRAAFACDLTRVVSFQYSPGTNHVAFQGFWPDNPNAIYMHHPVSHRISGPDIDATSNRRPEVEFLVEIEVWYNQLTAAFLSSLKTGAMATDVFGNTLLDHTLVPYVTEVARATHEWDPVPAVLFGGRSLGVAGGQFLRFDGRPHNDMWLTIAQALGVGVDALAGEKILTGPYDGVLDGVLTA
jgi:hypothetical protein